MIDHSYLTRGSSFLIRLFFDIILKTGEISEDSCRLLSEVPVRMCHNGREVHRMIDNRAGRSGQTEVQAEIPFLDNFEALHCTFLQFSNLVIKFASLSLRSVSKLLLQ